MSSKLQTVIARTLKSLRLEKKLSQEDLADLCNLDRTYISGVERASRNPTINTLERIISALDINEIDFFLKVIEELSNEKFENQ
jgi:transcriptional regulator with XRE-family HTH domain